MIKTIQPSYKIEYISDNVMQHIEKIGRLCYKSEDKIKDGSADTFNKALINRGHEAMLEHSLITVKFISNRGFTHELVRHRHSAFSQESTRYVKYSDGRMRFIEPYWLNIEYIKDQEKTLLSYKIWEKAMFNAENSYNEMAKFQETDATRGILPNDIKAEIVISTNIREWRSIFKLRTHKTAHPDMRRLMIPLLDELKKRLPIMFGDIEVSDD